MTRSINKRHDKEREHTNRKESERVLQKPSRRKDKGKRVEVGHIPSLYGNTPNSARPS